MKYLFFHGFCGRLWVNFGFSKLYLPSVELVFDVVYNKTIERRCFLWKNKLLDRKLQN